MKERAIRKFKARNASDIDGINANVLKYGGVVVESTLSMYNLAGK